MTDATSVREAVRGDRDRILAIDPLAREGSDRVCALDALLEGAHVVVAEGQGEILGYAALDYSFYGHGFIPLVYVAETERRRGVGRALVRWLCSQCRTRKLFTSTNRSNRAMQHLLQGLGFVSSGVIHNLDPGDPEIVFMRELAERSGQLGTGRNAAAGSSGAGGASRPTRREGRARSAPVVRRLARGEWRAYRELRLRALADSPEAFATTLAEARARDEASWERQAAAGAESPSQIALVAESGSRLVGLAWSRLDEAEPGRVHLYQMWVDPEFRRRGTGRRLLEAALRWAASVGGRRVVLSVTVGRSGATRLYERAGFEPAGPPEPLREGSELRVQPMALELRAP